KKCRDAWARWWKDHGAKVDMTRLESKKRCLGRTLLSSYEANRIVEIGADGKPRWSIDKLGGPVDAVVLPGNRVLIAEFNAKKVTERDFQGKVLWEKGGFAGHPVNVQRLPNGNTFVATSLHICEYDRAGKESYAWSLGKTILGASKGRDGHVWCLVDGGLCLELDPSGKVLSSFPSNRDRSHYCGIALLPRSGGLMAPQNHSRI